MNVKSSVRTLQVFEYFEHVRRPISVMELAKEFGWPMSSTSVLLKSLCDHGYLYRVDNKAAFSPTMRLPVLGSWLQAGHADGFKLANFVVQVREALGYSAVLSMRHGLDSQYLYVRLAPLRIEGVISQQPKPGARRPLCRCAAGIALMSTMSDKEVSLIVRNSIGLLGPCFEPERTLAAIARAREHGYAWHFNSNQRGIGDIALPLKEKDMFGNVLVLSMGVPLAVLMHEHEQLGQALQEQVDAFSRGLSTASPDRRLEVGNFG